MSLTDTHQQTTSNEEVLERDGSVSIHHKNIETFAVEMFKIKYNIFPETVSDIFLAETGYYYNFRQQNDFLYLPYKHYIIKVKTNLT